MSNLRANLSDARREEVIAELLARPDVRIEPTVSQEQVKPVYDQDEDEWVLLLAGQAEFRLEHSGTHRLVACDHLAIPAHCRHRVTLGSKSGANLARPALTRNKPGRLIRRGARLLRAA